MDAPYHILLAEGHKQLRQEIIRIISLMQGTTLSGVVGSGRELNEFLERFASDLLIMDICLPGVRALNAVQEIRGRHPQLKILILTADRDPEYLVQATAAGANGCLPNEEADLELPQAIDALRRGETYRSSRMAARVREKISDLSLAPQKPFL